jgi:ferrous iron transport protein B
MHNHGEHSKSITAQDGKIALIGSPNVGKSVIFHRLTGRYATVSNYPGTTVEISRGVANLGGKEYEVIDTPGTYSLYPLSEDEKVTQKIIVNEAPDIIVHIIDAKNTMLMLPLTFELIETGLPIILVVNMLDEAGDAGFEIDLTRLQEILGIPVVGTIATERKGIDELKDLIANLDSFKFRKNRIEYPRKIEHALNEMEALLTDEFVVSRKFLSQLILAEDEGVEEILEKEPKQSALKKLTLDLKSGYKGPLKK